MKKSIVSSDFSKLEQELADNLEDFSPLLDSESPDPERSEERIIPPPHQWIMIDLKGNWLGLRVEPENKERSEAFKDAVPKEDRWYHRQERKWMFRTIHGSLLFDLLRTLCPDHILILEEGNSQIIRSILAGPSMYVLEQEQKEKKLPQGFIVGKMGEQ